MNFPNIWEYLVAMVTKQKYDRLWCSCNLTYSTIYKSVWSKYFNSMGHYTVYLFAESSQDSVLSYFRVKNHILVHFGQKHHAFWAITQKKKQQEFWNFPKNWPQSLSFMESENRLKQLSLNWYKWISNVKNAKKCLFLPKNVIFHLKMAINS